VTATTWTTIKGVSVLSSEKKRGQDVFEVALSYEGIEVRRPERRAQRMSWDRVSEWETEERKGYVLLTLRGDGATTPLVVPGWTRDELEVLMRDVTSGGTAPERTMPEPVEGDAAVPVVATSDPGQDAPAAASEVPAAPDALPTRAERRTRAARVGWLGRLSWRVIVTVLLLGVLAIAVILVLLQSAGIIDWSFLGPTA
jgi:hypothetical protein